MWLVKFSKDWADEFDAEGFTLLTDEQKSRLETLVEEGNFDYYFGTNEGFDAGDIDLEDFTFVQLTEGEVKLLQTLFPEVKSGAFGQMFDVEFIDEALLNTTE